MRWGAALMCFVGSGLGSSGAEKGLVDQLNRKECREVSEITPILSALFYKSVISPESLLFLSSTAGVKDKKIKKALAKTINEQSKEISKNIECLAKKNKNELIAMIKKLNGIERSESKGIKGLLKLRSELYKSDKSDQVLLIHGKMVDNLIRKVSLLTDADYELLLSLLRRLSSRYRALTEKFIGSFLSLKKKIEPSVNVKTKLENAERDFNTEVEKELREKVSNRYRSALERARFNLGGSIVSPNLMLQMAGGIDGKEAFVKALARGVFNPVLLLKGKLQGRSDSEVKEGVLEFIDECLGKLSKYPLREEIETGFVKRSELMERFTRSMRDKKEVTKVIEEAQDRGTREMLEVLRGEDPKFFKKFLIVDDEVIKRYKKILLTGDRNSEDMEYLWKTFGVS